MKIILLGASGIIGREIDQALSPQHEIVRAGRNGDVKVDYTDTKSVKAMFDQVGKFDALVAAVGGDSSFKAYDQLTDEDFHFGFQRKFMHKSTWCELVRLMPMIPVHLPYPVDISVTIQIRPVQPRVPLMQPSILLRGRWGQCCLGEYVSTLSAQLRLSPLKRPVVEL